MRKIKIEERMKNAVSAFFSDGGVFDENRLSVASSGVLLKQETDARLAEKADILVKILKRAFLFFPGVLYLFFGTLTILEFNFLHHFLDVLTVFSIGSFMTIFGVGSLKNPRHLAIPLSVVVVALTAFSAFAVFEKTKYVFEYGIYFFPLALVAPLLAKSLVGDSRRETN